MPTTQSALTGVEICNILSNERRQAVIKVLDEQDKVTLRDLSQALAEVEEQQRKTVHIGLYQSHIPKMCDYNVITYDEPTGTVASSENFNRVSEALRCLGEIVEREGYLDRVEDTTLLR